MTRTAVLVAAAVAVALAAVGLSAWQDDGPEPRRADVVAPAGSVPSVIVAVVDDMNDWPCRQTPKYLPRSSKWLYDEGRCFERTTTTSPVCCPARAEIMSGRYPHNNRVRRQKDARKLDTRLTIQRFLGDAGLSTYAVGKFLNGIDPSAYVTGDFDTRFDEFDLWLQTDYYDYVLHDDEGVAYQPDPPVHTTVRTGAYLRDFVGDMIEQDRAFYAYAGFHAPHVQNGEGGGFEFPEPTPANADRKVPRFRYQPERGRRDKLLPFHKLEKGHGRRYFESLHAARVRSLYDVDDQLASLFRMLEESGRLDDTAVFVVSDNGYHLGSNGWEGKATPYPDSIDVPMLAYLPAEFGSGVHDDRRAGLVDLAPTIYDLVGVSPRYEVDGHSLLGSARRTREYHEFTNERSRFVLDESGHAPFDIPTWAELVLPNGDAYIEFFESDGGLLRREYYTDAGRERNLLAPQHRAERPEPSRLARLHQALTELRGCAGTAEQDVANPCP